MNALPFGKASVAKKHGNNKTLLGRIAAIEWHSDEQFRVNYPFTGLSALLFRKVYLWSFSGGNNFFSLILNSVL